VIVVNAAFIGGLVVVLVQTLPLEQLPALWQWLLQVGSRAKALIMYQLGVHDSAIPHRHCAAEHTGSAVHRSSAAGNLRMLGVDSGSSASQRALQRLRALTQARFKDADIAS
jgi:hypothetical protein